MAYALLAADGDIAGQKIICIKFKHLLKSMADPITLTTAIDNASKVANTPLFTTVIDKITGFKISQWAAEGEVRKKVIYDEYEKAKSNGIIGIQYIENLRHTSNLIDIAVKSSKYIDQNKSNDIKMDNDFFWNLLEHAKTISNEEVQELIAKIIAGEYSQQGSYSLSTLQILKMIGKNELELFEKVSSLCIHTHLLPQKVFTSLEDLESIVVPMDIDYSSLQILQNLGLFLPHPMHIKIKSSEWDKFEILYFEKPIIYKSLYDREFKVESPSVYEMSITGKQIIQHLSPIFIEEYYNWLKENLTISNYYIIKE